MSEHSSKNWYFLAQSIGLTTRHDLLEELYVNQGLSLSQVAERLSCSLYTIRRNLIKENIKRRPKGGPNSLPYQSRSLFRHDQRVVLNCPSAILLPALNISTSLLYHYRTLMKGNQK